MSYRYTVSIYRGYYYFFKFLIFTFFSFCITFPKSDISYDLRDKFS